MSKGLILTGGCGFMGINFLLQFPKILKDKYEKIISVDELSCNTICNKEIYSELCKGLNIERFDMNIKDIRGQSYFDSSIAWDIVDFACTKNMNNSILNESIMYSNNTMIPLNLLLSFEDILSIKNYYHISSSEVYGELPLSASESQWFTPKSPLAPKSIYGASKAAQDILLSTFKNIPIHIIRIGNQYGPFQSLSEMIPKACISSIKNEPIKIIGQGLKKQQWTPIEITIKILFDKIISEEQFDCLHIANNRGVITDSDLMYIMAETIEFFTKNRPQIEYTPGNDVSTLNAIKTAKEIDNYFKDVSLDQSLANTIEFYYLKKSEFI